MGMKTTIHALLEYRVILIVCYLQVIYQNLVKPRLLANNTPLKSTVMLSPHHGSDTSSSVNFISDVAPKVVIHSSAYKGQWEFPKPLVVERYNANKRSSNLRQALKDKLVLNSTANNLAHRNSKRAGKLLVYQRLTFSFISSKDTIQGVTVFRECYGSKYCTNL